MPNYPYISGQKALVAAFNQLRKSFPSKVDAGYLKRFKIAPSNESYVINILRFLNLVSEDGTQDSDKTAYFFKGDADFNAGLEGSIRQAYADLFSEMGDGAITASRDELMQWFRGADKTTDLVGGRQASTFRTLLALAGHGDPPVASEATSRPNGGRSRESAKRKTTPRSAPKPPAGGGAEDQLPPKPLEHNAPQKMGLTVRIEVNLPVGGDADTYDSIFASIRKHLIS